MKKFLECALVTICYWIVIFIGPSLVILWNNWCYYVSGLGYGEGSLMYKVLVAISQPASCILAYVAATNISKNKHSMSVMVNCVFGTLVFGIFSALNICQNNYSNLLCMLVSAIACNFTVYLAAKELEQIGALQKIVKVKKSEKMSKVQKIFGYVLVTASIWGIARFVPAFFRAAYPNSVIINILALYVALPIGWTAAKSISKGRFSGCIRGNLYVLCIIEVIGLFSTILPMLQRFAFATGISSTDINGIAYSDYPFILIATIISEVVYIAFCTYLIKKTATISEDPAQKKVEAIEKHHDEKQELRDRIAKAKNDLKEFDASYIQNKKILEESFTDEQLQKMVLNGEFPADRVEEYKSQRNGLTLFVNYAPKMRDDAVKLIDDLTKKLAELEASN